MSLLLLPSSSSPIGRNGDFGERLVFFHVSIHLFIHPSFVHVSIHHHLYILVDFDQRLLLSMYPSIKPSSSIHIIIYKNLILTHSFMHPTVIHLLLVVSVVWKQYQYRCFIAWPWHVQLTTHCSNHLLEKLSSAALWYLRMQLSKKKEIVFHCSFEKFFKIGVLKTVTPLPPPASRSEMSVIYVLISL